ncbi:MAG TPA: hypothetical protein VNO84_13875 [Burkholderiaceae bacterium]|nr:hypothetical protein [Burkholderiaceae bacterium]
MKRLPLLGAAWALALPVWAHEGHHAPGAHHWHATDVFGYIVLAAVVAAALWWGGRK